MKKLGKLLLSGVTLVIAITFMFNLDDRQYMGNNHFHNTTSVNTGINNTNNVSNYTTKTKTSGTTDKKTTATTENNQKTAIQITDKRIPNYQGTETDYKKKKYTWTTHDNRKAYATLYVDYNVYDYYSSLGRYYHENEYTKYTDDSYSQAYAKSVADILRDIQKKAGYSDYETVLEAINFVQQCIKYTSDGATNYPQYIVETLYKGKGDCEDSAMLLASIIKELGYGSVLLLYSNHMAVGVMADRSTQGTYYEYGGNAYYYVEPTNTGWDIGQVPADYVGKSAIVLNVW